MIISSDFNMQNGGRYMKFEEALKKIENGGVITTPDKDKDGSAIMIHNYKGKYYSRYGNEINTDNQYLSGISTWEVSSKNFSDVLIDIMHQFIAGETMNVMDYTRCALNQTFLDFDRDVFNSQINRQLFIVNTSYEAYIKNVITILSFINHALIRHVYDHIYVFVKDEWLYKDTAKKLPYSGVFEVNENNFNITFIFVRESASCVGWIDNVFEIKQGCRILRIYDQRVTEGISQEDLVQGYFSSQQDHDDCLYFLSSDISMNKKKKKTEDSGEYWIDLYDKTADPHLFYEYTLARLMIGTLSCTPDYDDDLCNSNDLMKIQTNLTFMNM